MELTRTDELLRKHFLGIDEVAELMQTSRRTIERRMKARTFPVKPLPALDRTVRFSTSEVAGVLLRIRSHS